MMTWYVTARDARDDRYEVEAHTASDAVHAFITKNGFTRGEVLYAAPKSAAPPRQWAAYYVGPEILEEDTMNDDVWAIAGRAMAERDRLREECATLHGVVAKTTAERDEARRSSSENEKDVTTLLQRRREDAEEKKRAYVLIRRLSNRRCAANSDGECDWSGCTQNVPETRLTGCPYYNWEDD